MKKLLTRTIGAIALGATALSLGAAPALADPPGHAKGRGEGHWKGKGKGHYKHGDYRPHRTVRVVHVYDYNRPDPRWHGYYPNRYYAGGYAPVRVTRGMRIYRGSDDRYYCRRSDGTTGLIIGAALGGLIGSRIDRGESSLAGTLIGAGAGALLGRAIDRGELVCR